MEIRATDKGVEVRSDSGATYEITEQSARFGYEYDPEYMWLWACDCPAGQHGRDCKHLRAFLARLDNEALPEIGSEWEPLKEVTK